MDIGRFPAAWAGAVGVVSVSCASASFSASGTSGVGSNDFFGAAGGVSLVLALGVVLRGVAGIDDRLGGALCTLAVLPAEEGRDACDMDCVR